MASQSDLDHTYMSVAYAHARLSKATRMHVGACMVLESGIIIPGVNGLPKSLGNVCETEDNVTKSEVIHAEAACILKAAKEGVSVRNSTVYITHPPCRHCASMIVSCNIRRVVYDNTYRDLSGLDLLAQGGLEVIHYKEI